MISGFPDVSMTPRTNITHIWRDQNTSTISRKSQLISKYLISGNIKTLEVENFEKWKRWGPTNPDDPSNEFLEILNTGSIYLKTEMGIW